ncbi:glutathione S-transferase family protein [Maricaulis sp.]|uniref:glutathione S-transferase family protein n=1 Tax=Maricaulis sp. TaxID=1486257 RepID=UPI00261FE912|nr:glutathione S-transferase family protein [Maricaulis sp.]
MKFYDCLTAPSPRRVRMFLAEKGIEIDTVQVDLRQKEQLSDAFLAINPRGTVPALQLDDGTVLCDGASIMRYIEETHPDRPLLGATPLEKAMVAEWTARIEFEGFMATAEAFRNSSKAFKDAALTGPVAHAQIPELAERGRARVADFFAVLDQRLRGSAYVAGDNFTAADIAAFVFVEFSGWIKLVPEEGQTALKAWRDAVAARPSAAV